MKLSRFTEKQLHLFFAGIVALFTIFNALLWWNGREELNQLKKTAQGELILNLNRDVFLNDRLYKLRKAIETGKPILPDKGGKFTEQDIDDYIGYFDLMQGFVEREILDKDLTVENFCAFAEDAYKNQEIATYLKTLRKQNPKANYYKGFELLAKECSKWPQ